MAHTVVNIFLFLGVEEVGEKKSVKKCNNLSMLNLTTS
jgi:hypothetical protein